MLKHKLQVGEKSQGQTSFMHGVFKSGYLSTQQMCHEKKYSQGPIHGQPATESEKL